MAETDKIIPFPVDRTPIERRPSLPGRKVIDLRSVRGAGEITRGSVPNAVERNTYCGIVIPMREALFNERWMLYRGRSVQEWLDTIAPPGCVQDTSVLYNLHALQLRVMTARLEYIRRNIMGSEERQPVMAYFIGYTGNIACQYEWGDMTDRVLQLIEREFSDPSIRDRLYDRLQELDEAWKKIHAQEGRGSRIISLHGGDDIA